MAAIRHQYVDDVVEKLEQYIDASASYIIGMETAEGVHQDTSGQHLHFAVQITDKEYDAFRKTVFVKGYSLRGQARSGRARQYGQIKDVRDETKFLAYTVKENNLKTRYIEPETLKNLIELSFKKELKKTFTEALMEHLGELKHKNQITKTFSENNGSEAVPYNIELLILKYHIDHSEKPLCLSRLRYYTNLFLQKYYRKYNDIEELQQTLSYLKNSL